MGVNNHRYFLAFLFSIVALLLTVIVTIAIHVNSYDSSLGGNFLTILPDSLYIKVVFVLAVIVNMGTACLFVLPVLLLALIQMKNFCTNKTTNERFARRPTVTSDFGSRTSSMASTGGLGEDQHSHMGQ